MKGNQSRYAWDYFGVAFLGGVAVLFLAGPIIAGKTLFGSDFVLQFFPWKDFIYEHLRQHGALPFWNPYVFSGTPFITNMQASMFYPLGFLYYLMPPDLAYGCSTVFHGILGCIFMYAFMRSISVPAMGSIASALIFLFNGYFLGHLYAGHLTFVQNYIWIPLIFFFVHRFLQQGRPRHAVAAGIVLGVQILGGFPQIAFYTILGILAFGCAPAGRFLRSGSFRRAFTVLSGLAVLLFLGFAVSAVQVLPTLEFNGLSTREGGLSYAFATYHSLDPAELLAFLVPDLFGSVIDGTYWRIPEGWHSLETCAYVGLLPFFLAFVRIEDRDLRQLKIFFVLLCIAALFLALGRNNPLYPLIYRFPGFRSFRIPAQIIFLYIFGMAVITGLGLQRVQAEGWVFSRGFWVFVLGLGAFFLVLFVGHVGFPHGFYLFLFKTFSHGPVGHADVSELHRRMANGIGRGFFVFLAVALILLMRRRARLNAKLLGMLAVFVLVVDLYLFGAQFVQPYEFVRSQDKEEIVAKLYRKAPDGRIATQSDLFLPNDGLQYRFPSIEGYDPLLLRRYLQYIRFSQAYARDDHIVKIGGKDLRFPGAKLLRMLNLKQMIVGRRILERENGVPYAAVVGQALIKPSKEILPFMASDAFDPGKVVVFEPEYQSRLLKTHEGAAPQATWTLKEYGDERISLTVATDQPGYLVLSEVFYPGWRALVDGKEVPVLCGNFLFRVVPLAKGKQDVVLFFVSWPFRIGAIISLLACVGSLCFILWTRKNPACNGRTTQSCLPQKEKITPSARAEGRG